MKSDPLLPGSVFGGILLVSGSCIGAGMLALPIATGLAGFFPSLVAMFLAWAFMTFTGLILVEISGWFFGQVNLVSMAQESLGATGKWVAWLSYLFLFYSLLVAYVAASGTIFSDILKEVFGLSIPGWFGSLLFTGLFGWIIYLGTKPVDLFNRLLMFGLIAAYIGMVGVGVAKIDPKLLLHYAPKYVFSSLPILVVSFGFQNVIPSLAAYLKGDLRRVRLAIMGGSLMTLAVYLLWSLLVQGIVPYEGAEGILSSFQQGKEATHALNAALHSKWLTVFAQGFAFFAIVTSFLAQGLTLTHFLADGLKISPIASSGRLLTFVALVPPLLFALYDPTVFFKALNFAGGICAVILFGILPTAMAWIGRYQKRITSNYHVTGGRTSLIFAAGFSVFVIACELMRLAS
jgi:tyrosine-specific transport protein